MGQIVSPDQPAYVCYLLVIVVGFWVAYGRVNRLMASSPGRWAFFETWLVFLAYAIVPVILFWILDYTNAIHDTSVFAALLVAVSYRQILAGEVKETPVAGQLSALWSPFEAWGVQVRDRIVSKNKVRSDRFSENLRVELSKTAQTVTHLVELAYFVANDTPVLTQDLSGISQEPIPPGLTQQAFDNIQARRKVDRCMMSIRLVNPEDYGFLLKQRSLISALQYWLWIGDVSTRLSRFLGLIVLTLLLYVAVSLFFRPCNILQYHLWRFQKPNTTELDRFRTHNFLAGQIAKPQCKDEWVILDPLVRLLRYRDLDRRVAEDVLSLTLEFRSPKLDQRTVPMLIEALRTENPDVRLRIHQTLKALRDLDYANSINYDTLADWVPAKSDSAALIEEKIKRYWTWWNTVAPKTSPPGTTVP